VRRTAIFPELGLLTNPNVGNRVFAALAVRLGIILPLRYELIPPPDYRHIANISSVFGLWIQTEPLPGLTESFDLKENTQTLNQFFSVVM